MKLTVVANSTPLIALARIDRLNVLQEMFGDILIPRAVYNEVATDSKKRSGSSEVEQCAWIKAVDIARSDLLDFLIVTVDAGEAEAIALAREIKADLLLIDDKEGRRIADSVGQAITGTIGLLLRYYKGQPEAFKKSFDELLEQGFRLKNEEYERIVAMAQ
jgi:predicted nucleic acid-binding protein